MKELLKEPCHHCLMEDNMGRLLLEVECGTTAVFLLTIELNAGERRRFEEDGAGYIRDLAYQVQDNTDEFLGRRTG